MTHFAVKDSNSGYRIEKKGWLAGENVSRSWQRSRHVVYDVSFNRFAGPDCRIERNLPLSEKSIRKMMSDSYDSPVKVRSRSFAKINA